MFANVNMACSRRAGGVTRLTRVFSAFLACTIASSWRAVEANCNITSDLTGITLTVPPGPFKHPDHNGRCYCQQRAGASLGHPSCEYCVVHAMGGDFIVPPSAESFKHPDDGAECWCTSDDRAWTDLKCLRCAVPTNSGDMIVADGPFSHPDHAGNCSCSLRLEEGSVRGGWDCDFCKVQTMSSGEITVPAGSFAHPDHNRSCTCRRQSQGWVEECEPANHCEVQTTAGLLTVLPGYQFLHPDHPEWGSCSCSSGPPYAWSCSSCAVETLAKGIITVGTGPFTHPDYSGASCVCGVWTSAQPWHCDTCAVETEHNGTAVVPSGEFQHPDFPSIECKCKGKTGSWQCKHCLVNVTTNVSMSVAPGYFVHPGKALGTTCKCNNRRGDDPSAWKCLKEGAAKTCPGITTSTGLITPFEGKFSHPDYPGADCTCESRAGGRMEASCRYCSIPTLQGGTVFVPPGKFSHPDYPPGAQCECDNRWGDTPDDWECQVCTVEAQQGQVTVLEGDFVHPDFPAAECTCESRFGRSSWSCKYCSVPTWRNGTIYVGLGSFSHPDYPAGADCECDNRWGDEPDEWECRVCLVEAQSGSFPVLPGAFEHPDYPGAQCSCEGRSFGQSRWTCKYCMVPTEQSGTILVPPGDFTHPDLPVNSQCWCDNYWGDDVDDWSCDRDAPKQTWRLLAPQG